VSWDDTTRWCAAGASVLGDSAGAAEEAVRRALAQATGDTGVGADQVVLAVAFVSAAHDLAAVATGLRRLLAADVPVVGCTTAGEIAEATGRDSDLAVMLFGGSGFSVRTAWATGLGEDSAGTGQRVAELLYADEDVDPGVIEEAEDGGPREVVMLLSDGLAGDQQAMVTGVYRVTGAPIPLVGGCAGDDLVMSATYQLIGGAGAGPTDRVLRDSVVGVRLRSDGPIGIGVRHGWTRVGGPLVVTAAEGSSVSSLDGRPALDAYLQVLDAPEQARTDPAAFTRFALNHPLGIAGRSQDLVRFVTGADFEARTLELVAPVPQGGLTWIMTGDVDSVLSASDEACRLAVEALEGRPARGVIAFDCIARRAALGEDSDEEIRRIGERVGDVPLIGFYTYGEIARTRGMGGFHNQTLVVLAVA